MSEEFNRRRDYMYERVSTMKLISALKPQGAFYLFVDVNETLDKKYKGEKIVNLTNLAKILIEDYNVAVIPCDDFGAPEHIRLSYAISMEQIKKGLDRIEAFLDQLV
jgi:aspartate aminotransferase